MVDYYPFIAILLAFFLNSISGKLTKIAVSLLIISLLAVQQIQTYQAEQGIIHAENMNKSRYWSVFLKTNEELNNYFYLNPNAQTVPEDVSEE